MAVTVPELVVVAVSGTVVAVLVWKFMDAAVKIMEEDYGAYLSCDEKRRSGD